MIGIGSFACGLRRADLARRRFGGPGGRRGHRGAAGAADVVRGHVSERFGPTNQQLRAVRATACFSGSAVARAAWPNASIATGLALLRSAASPRRQSSS